jgi:mRNA interferase MazF
VLDPTVGHEQRGQRPCVVVSDPEILEEQRYPLLGIVPLTGTPGTGALYPSVQPVESGLTKVSYALADQVRSIDKRRVRRVLGRVTGDELRRIGEGLVLFFGLDSDDDSDSGGS